MQAYQNRRICAGLSGITTGFWGQAEEKIEQSPIYEIMPEVGFKVGYDGIKLLRGGEAQFLVENLKLGNFTM